ncbi:flagellar hook-basal body protein [Halobacillus massiliensis]|uniref:flagellar hook-basal body protein n=1 Tax=Halobacillus massiliensis TaxID=1926286 RepID=UPI0009E2BD6A|nr:flagellar hook-basal body protein [Halobacillus massiliensis]
MNLSMIQASNTLGQLQHKLDQIGHNLSNTSTTGYKSRQSNFSSMLTQQINNQSNVQAEDSRLTPNGIRSGAGAKIGHTNLNLTRGTFQQTNRELDTALKQENHLFKVQKESSAGLKTEYTRAGNFYLNVLENGNMLLTTSAGDPILGVNEEPIVIEGNAEDITFREDGAVLVTRNGTIAVEGQLGVMEAIRPGVLESVGGNHFKLPENMDTGGILQQADAQIVTGMLESSNVDLAREITELQTVQKGYEFNTRSISMGDQMMGLVNQLRS